MYLVISFDFQGQSNVTLHCMTPHLTAASQIYDTLYDNHPSVLTELIEVDEFVSLSGYILYWGSTDATPEVKVLRSTNV